jgi:small-conductance mechanosensitive channel
MYFEQAKSYFEKYLSNMDEALLFPDDLISIEEQKKIFSDFIKNINSGAIILCLNSFKVGELYNIDEIKSSGTGFTEDLKKFGINKILAAVENHKIILDNYERLLSTIQNDNQFMKNEAICIACIIKLNISLGYLASKRKTLLNYVKRCNSLIKKLKINENEKWYKEYMEIYKKNFEDKEIKDEVYQEILNRIKKKI